MKGLSVVFTILLFVVALALSGFLKKANALPSEPPSNGFEAQPVQSLVSPAFASDEDAETARTFVTTTQAIHN